MKFLNISGNEYLGKFEQGFTKAATQGCKPPRQDQINGCEHVVVECGNWITADWYCDGSHTKTYTYFFEQDRTPYSIQAWQKWSFESDAIDASIALYQSNDGTEDALVETTRRSEFLSVYWVKSGYKHLDILDAGFQAVTGTSLYAALDISNE